jgi:hypothetical protein
MSRELNFLAAYSPDLNPIELAFSKLKAHLRKAAERTILRLLRRIGRVVTDFSPQECRKFHAGYARTASPGCCARTAFGHTAAAPPSSVIKSRLFNRSNCIYWPNQLRGSISHW